MRTGWAETPSALLLASLLVVCNVGCIQSLRDDKILNEGTASERSLVLGDSFQHLILRRGSWSRSRQVHVYLEGDGLPWVTRTRVARDPTPRNPLALRLMAQDPEPTMYLGRPCYHGLARSPGCSPRLWTHGRYSEEVVSSMAAALRRALGSGLDRELTLIGYSGGGVLAMLIAPRFEQVRHVVTVAANLDIDAWARHHGYSRLRGSLNPASQPPLSPRIRQVHLGGGSDLRVPTYSSRPVVTRQPNARFLLVPRFDHTCCWERDWPAILAVVTDKDRRSFAADVPLRSEATQEVR